MKQKIAIVVALVLALTVGWQVHQKQNRDAVNAGLSTDVNTTGDINVFAASSLTETFTQLGKEFEASHPGVKVNFTFGSSSTLAQQIKAGAPARIFASASEKQMNEVGDRVTSPQNFVSNRVILAHVCPLCGVMKGTTVASVLNGGKSIWIQCAHEVPCGAAADKALAAEGVTVKPKSLEPDAKSVLAKLVAGEADDAVVYFTDFATNPNLAGVEFANKEAATTTYSIGVLDNKDALAGELLNYLMSPRAMNVYSQAGFGVPAQ
jgi:molybdate transport system substrate-binding protein